MKVGLAICPNSNPNTPPISLAYLASYLRAKDIEVICLDFNIDLYFCADEKNKSLWTPHMWQEWLEEAKSPLAAIDDGAVKRWVEIIQRESIQIIGFSLLSTNFYTTMRIAKKVRELFPDIRIIIGGPEVLRQLLLHNEIIWSFANIAIIGEGEERLYEAINWLTGKNREELSPAIVIRENREVMTVIKSSFSQIDDFPYPDYSFFPLHYYKETGQLPLIFSRGCIGRCAFCFERRYWGNYRCRSVENVLGEMRQIKKKFNIWCFSLCDSLINGNMNFLSDFCDKVIAEDLQVNWWGMARINSLMTEKFIEKMVRAGCKQIAYGVESGSQKLLNLMAKGYSTSIIDKVISDTCRAGIKPGINIMLGFPGEEEEDFEQTCKFVMRNAKFISYINISILGIEPGTEIYENKKKFGVLGTDVAAWETTDRRNTLQIRVKRAEILQRIVDEYIGKVVNFASR